MLQFLFFVGEFAAASFHSLRLLHHRAVLLVLRERAIQQPVGFLPALGAEHVDRHVVAGAERGIERIGARGGQPRYSIGIDSLGPQHHGVTDGIDATPARTARELRVLARGEIHVGFTVELDELFQHHRAGGHVDAQGQSLGSETDLEQPAGEQILHDVAERGQHPGVVAGETTGQTAAEMAEAQDF